MSYRKPSNPIELILIGIAGLNMLVFHFIGARDLRWTLGRSSKKIRDRRIKARREPSWSAGRG